MNAWTNLTVQLMADWVMGKIRDIEDKTDVVKYLIMFRTWLAAMQESSHKDLLTSLWIHTIALHIWELMKKFHCVLYNQIRIQLPMISVALLLDFQDIITLLLNIMWCKWLKGCVLPLQLHWDFLTVSTHFQVNIFIQHSFSKLYIFLTVPCNLFSTQPIHTILCVYTKLRGWSHSTQNRKTRISTGWIYRW